MLLSIVTNLAHSYFRRKRTSKGIVISSGASPMDEHFWDCSVCTFRNNAEAFKCSMCDVRKGTSTRKPRLNPDIVAAQQAQVHIYTFFVMFKIVFILILFKASHNPSASFHNSYTFIVHLEWRRRRR